MSEVEVTCGVYQSLTEDQWLSVLSVMQELRPQYSLEQLKKQMMLQFNEGYHLVVASVKGEIVGLAGGVFGQKLAWGKHLYIDDLVVSEKQRGQAVGQVILNYCFELAKTQGCDSVHLDSGTQRQRAHGFYFKQGMPITSFHFNRSLK